MNASPFPLLAGLATLRVSTVRFTITRDRGLHGPTALQVTYVDQARSTRPGPAVSVTAFFEAFALPPLKGTYTLSVGEGTLCYDPLGPDGRRGKAPPASVRARS